MLYRSVKYSGGDRCRKRWRAVDCRVSELARRSTSYSDARPTPNTRVSSSSAVAPSTFGSSASRVRLRAGIGTADGRNADGRVSSTTASTSVWRRRICDTVLVEISRIVVRLSHSSHRFSTHPGNRRVDGNL